LKHPISSFSGEAGKLLHLKRRARNYINNGIRNISYISTISMKIDIFWFVLCEFCIFWGNVYNISYTNNDKNIVHMTSGSSTMAAPEATSK
jgi:hypothetical protein